MTKMKKILAVALCVLLLGSVFAGCSGKKAEQTTEITDETLLIAATEIASAEGKAPQAAMQNAGTAGYIY